MDRSGPTPVPGLRRGISGPYPHRRHTGMALVGNIGTRGKLKYGALGDTLNTASRVEAEQHIGSHVAVSGETRPVLAPYVSSRW